MKVGDKIKCINCNKKFDVNVYHSLDINIIKHYLKARGYDIENPKKR